MSHELYHRNVEVFCRRYAAIMTHLDSLDVSAYDICQSHDGSSYLKVKTSRGGAITIGDMNSPLHAVQSHLPEVHNPEKCVFLVMGIGLGHLLLEAVRKYPLARFIVVEHDGRIFRRAMETFDFSKLFESPNIEFAVSLNENLLARYFLGLFAHKDYHIYLPNLHLIMDPKVICYSRPYYTKVAETVRLVMDDFWEGVVGNDYRDALTGLDFILKNLCCHGRYLDVETLRDKTKGRIGIVVSSGPSLENKLADLKRLQDRAVIICADSALKKLLSHGIRPFGVASIERDLQNDKLFQGMDIPTETILFAPPLIKPNIIPNYPGPVCYLGKVCYPFPWLPKLAPLWEMGHSCSHVALRVLDHLGCREIMLMGQDLAYDRNSGASHCKELVSFVADEFAPAQKVMVPDNRGGQIESNNFWIMFRNEFQNMILLSVGTPVKNVIERDCGLKIESAILTDPAECFSMLAREPVFQAQENWQSASARFSDVWSTERRDFCARYDANISGLEGLAKDLSKLATCSSFAEFAQVKRMLRENLDEESWYLFEELAKPSLWPFEANAFSQWQEDRLHLELKHFVPFFQNICHELVNTLKEHRNELFV